MIEKSERVCRYAAVVVAFCAAIFLLIVKRQQRSVTDKQTNNLADKFYVAHHYR
jgi:hypothetical protein